MYYRLPFPNNTCCIHIKIAIYRNIWKHQQSITIKWLKTISADGNVQTMIKYIKIIPVDWKVHNFHRSTKHWKLTIGKLHRCWTEIASSHTGTPRSLPASSPIALIYGTRKQNKATLWCSFSQVYICVYTCSVHILQYTSQQKHSYRSQRNKILSTTY